MPASILVRVWDKSKVVLESAGHRFFSKSAGLSAVSRFFSGCARTVVQLWFRVWQQHSKLRHLLSFCFSEDSFQEGSPATVLEGESPTNHFLRLRGRCSVSGLGFAGLHRRMFEGLGPDSFRISCSGFGSHPPSRICQKALAFSVCWHPVRS